MTLKQKMGLTKNLDELRLVLDTELSEATAALQSRLDDMVMLTATYLSERGTNLSEGYFSKCGNDIEDLIRRVNAVKGHLEVFRLTQVRTLDEVAREDEHEDAYHHGSDEEFFQTSEVQF